MSPEPQNTLVDRINGALNSSGPNFILSLCPNTEYKIDNTLVFAANGQEISTQGYPTGDSRAMISILGDVVNGTGLATLIQGNCADCDNIKLRNVQVRACCINLCLERNFLLLASSTA